MNKLIKEQLQKVSVADISNYDEKNQIINIPKFKQDRYIVGTCYLVCLDDTLLNDYGNPILVSNWNKGTYPRCKYMKIDVLKTMGKMINVNGIGFDYTTKQNTTYVWSGWLPIQLTKQVEILL